LSTPEVPLKAGQERAAAGAPSLQCKCRAVPNFLGIMTTAVREPNHRN
jgi:hypothetical protein